MAPSGAASATYRCQTLAPPRVEYELTEKGEAMLPIIDAMRRFGRDWLRAETPVSV